MDPKFYVDSHHKSNYSNIENNHNSSDNNSNNNNVNSMQPFATQRLAEFAENCINKRKALVECESSIQTIQAFSKKPKLSLSESKQLESAALTLKESVNKVERSLSSIKSNLKQELSQDLKFCTPAVVLENLHQFYLTREHTADCYFKIGKCLLPAHSNILCTKSSVIEKEIKTFPIASGSEKPIIEIVSYQEIKMTQNIDLDDATDAVDPLKIEALNEVIRYLYLGVTFPNKRNLIEIYLYSRLLSVEELRVKTAKELPKVIDDQNALSYLIKLQDLPFQDPVLHYILTYTLENALNVFNHSGLDHLAQLKQPILSTILRQDSLNLSEIEIIKIAFAWLNRQPQDGQLAQEIISCLRVDESVMNQIKALNLKIWDVEFQKDNLSLEKTKKPRQGTWFLPVTSLPFDYRIENDVLSISWATNFKNAQGNFALIKSPKMDINGLAFYIQVQPIQIGHVVNNLFIPSMFKINLMIKHLDLQMERHDHALRAIDPTDIYSIKLALIHNKLQSSIKKEGEWNLYKDKESGNPTFNFHSQTEILIETQKLHAYVRNNSCILQLQIKAPKAIDKNLFQINNF